MDKLNKVCFIPILVLLQLLPYEAFHNSVNSEKKINKLLRLMSTIEAKTDTYLQS